MTPRSGLLPLLALAGLAIAAAWWVLPGAHRAGSSGVRAAGARAGSPAAVAPADLEAQPAPRAARTEASPPPTNSLACLSEGESGLLGRVLDEQGHPVADALVLVVGAPHTEDAFQARGAARTTADGRFEVHSRRPGDIWLVAVTDGLRPAQRALALDEGYSTLRSALVLERGASLSGRVLVDDEPLACLELEAVLTTGGRRVRSGDTDLVLSDGRLEWAAPRARTASDGGWRIDGLGPGRRLLRPHAFRCANAVFPRTALEIDALDVPSEGVVLRIRAAHLVVRTEADGQPLAFADVELDGEGWRATRRTDAQGRLEVAVPPGQGVGVAVYAAGRAPRREVLSALREGEQREARVAAGPPLQAKVEDPRRRAAEALYRPRK